jgi:hypothetical protein
MPGTKYGQYLLKHTVVTEWYGTYLGVNGAHDFNSKMSLIYLIVNEPAFPEKAPHAHDYDEYLSFFGMRPDGLQDLGAEVEISFGQEQEKHVFNTPTTLFFPKGLLHCPLKFTRVDRPFMLVHIFLTPAYDRRGGEWTPLGRQ